MVGEIIYFLKLYLVFTDSDGTAFEAHDLEVDFGTETTTRSTNRG